MIRKVLAAGVLTIASACVAQAGDALSPDSVYDWSGPYLGVQLGYGWGDAVATESGTLFSQSSPFDTEGFLAGVHAGWNHQMGSLVLGVEGDVEFADVDGEFVFPNDDAYYVDANAIGSLRLRAGYAVDRLLLYGTGGLAVGSFELGLHNSDDGGITESHDKTFTGYTIGGGAEYAFSDAMSARIEYRYADFGNEGFTGEVATPFNYDYDLDMHAVRAGLSWHF